MSWADIPDWFQYLVRGIGLFLLLAFSTVILSRAGKSPYFALVMIIPPLAALAIWFFAFCRWPAVDTKEISERTRT